MYQWVYCLLFYVSLLNILLLAPIEVLYDYVVRNGFWNVLLAVDISMVAANSLGPVWGSLNPNRC